VNADKVPNWKVRRERSKGDLLVSASAPIGVSNAQVVEARLSSSRGALPPPAKDTFNFPKHTRQLPFPRARARRVPCDSAPAARSTNNKE
jgi:hypothetical protein